jgi:hypothetical protein
VGAPPPPRPPGGGDDRRTTTGGACPHYHRRPPATALCPAAAVVQHEGARGGNELGFSGEPAESGGFCSAEMHGWSSITMDGRELPEPAIPVFSPGGRSVRAVSTARSLVVGLQAQACTRLRSWTDHGDRQQVGPVFGPSGCRSRAGMAALPFCNKAADSVGTN